MFGMKSRSALSLLPALLLVGTISVCAWFSSCANIGSPNGGPTDEEPPILLKTELSYKRWLYPLLGVRECLVCFVPFVVLFILLSGVAAEKEMLYATEQETAKKSKKDKKKEEEAAKEEADIIASEAAEEQVTESTVPEEGAAPLAEENNDKEVL